MLNVDDDGVVLSAVAVVAKLSGLLMLRFTVRGVYVGDLGAIINNVLAPNVGFLDKLGK